MVVQGAGQQETAPRRPTAHVEEEEEYKEPDKNAETTWMIEDFTDTNRNWDGYIMRKCSGDSQWIGIGCRARRRDISNRLC